MRMYGWNNDGAAHFTIPWLQAIAVLVKHCAEAPERPVLAPVYNEAIGAEPG
jgi:hypothetical protein